MTIKEFGSFRRSDSSALSEAIINGEATKALWLVKSGTNFIWCENECNMLALAIKTCRNFELIKNLVASGGIEAINYVDARNLSPLHEAARSLDPDVLLLLLENKGDPNLKNWNKRTPLAFALRYSAIELCGQPVDPKAIQTIAGQIDGVTRLLVQHGANLDPTNLNEVSPLQDYVNRTVPSLIDYKLISYLIENGAVPKQREFRDELRVSEQIGRATEQGLAARKEKLTSHSQAAP